MPSTVLPPSASLRFYPDGNITRKPRFEQYREAWDLFRKKHLAPPRREPVAAEPETSTEEDPQPDSPADPPAPEPKSPLLRRMEEVADRIYKFNYGRPRPRD